MSSQKYSYAYINPRSGVTFEKEDLSPRKNLFKNNSYNFLPVALGFRDFDENGRPDMAWSALMNVTNESYFIDNQLSSGYPRFAVGTFRQTDNNLPIKHMEFADFNGDGKIDVVTAAGKNNLVSIRLNHANPSTTFGVETIISLIIGVEYLYPNN